jgi:hypothetical protein
MQAYYDAWEAMHAARRPVMLTALDALFSTRGNEHSSGFDRMAKCRHALEALDMQVGGIIDFIKTTVDPRIL